MNKHNISYSLTPEFSLQLNDFLKNPLKMDATNKEDLIGLTGLLMQLNVYYHIESFNKLLSFYQKAIDQKFILHALLTHSNIKNLDNIRVNSFLDLLHNPIINQKIPLDSFITTNLLETHESIQFQYYQCIYDNPINQSLKNTDQLEKILKKYIKTLFNQINNFIDIAKNVQLFNQFHIDNQKIKDLKKL